MKFLFSFSPTDFLFPFTKIIEMPEDTPRKIYRAPMTVSTLRSKAPPKPEVNNFPFTFPSQHKSSALGLFFSSTLTIRQEAELLLNSGPSSTSVPSKNQSGS